VIHDPALLPIRTRREARVANAICLVGRVLVEDAALVILAPVLHVHGVIADELELPEAVVAVVGAGGGVDDEVLAGLRVDQLFGTFI